MLEQGKLGYKRYITIYDHMRFVTHLSFLNVGVESLQSVRITGITVIAPVSMNFLRIPQLIFCKPGESGSEIISILKIAAFSSL